MTLRNEFEVVGISDQQIRLRQTMPKFEFLVDRSEFHPSIVEEISIGDLFSGIDRGASGPSDLVLERKAPQKESAASKEHIEPARTFVAGYLAGSPSDAEAYVVRSTEGAVIVIPGRTQRVAGGWSVETQKFEELYS